MKLKVNMNRRRFLQGAAQGSAVYMSLPFLSCFLNGSGTALADGRPLPTRFGTWHWGCGVNQHRFVPAATGANFELTPELKYLEAFKKQIVVLTGFNVPLDGHPNFVHHTGNMGIRAGAAPPANNVVAGETFDVTIAGKIGTGTRFRSIEAAATGDPTHSYSYVSSSIANPAEVSPIALYQRLFGSGFQDPNKAEFVPDPEIMLRKSVLSWISDDRKALMRELGSEDKARMDQYFTSVRQLETQLAVQLEKPAPAQACSVPKMPAEKHPGTEIETVIQNHRLMMELIAMALACNQTRVFNMVFSNSTSALRKAGTTVTHHLMTHEEPLDKALGYQPQSTFFIERSLEAMGTALQILSSVPEGDGTLLDHTLVFAHSDTNNAKVHEVDGVPIILAGKAGGKLKTGQHIAGNSNPVSQVGLSVQQLMGLPVDRWGAGSMETRKSVAELFV